MKDLKELLKYIFDIETENIEQEFAEVYNSIPDDVLEEILNFDIEDFSNFEFLEEKVLSDEDTAVFQTKFVIFQSLLLEKEYKKQTFGK